MLNNIKYLRSKELNDNDNYDLIRKILHQSLNEQYNMIEYLIQNWEKYQFLRKSFQAITDIEHLYRKIILKHSKLLIFRNIF